MPVAPHVVGQREPASSLPPQPHPSAFPRGAGFSFLLAAPLVLLVFATFLVGGNVQTLVCQSWESKELYKVILPALLWVPERGGGHRALGDLGWPCPQPAQGPFPFAPFPVCRHPRELAPVHELVSASWPEEEHQHPPGLSVSGKALAGDGVWGGAEGGDVSPHLLSFPPTFDVHSSSPGSAGKGLRSGVSCSSMTPTTWRST